MGLAHNSTQTTHFHFHGGALTISWSHAELGHAAAYVAECIGGLPGGRATDDADFFIELTEAASLPNVTEFGEMFAELDHGITLWKGQDKLWLGHANGVMSLNVETGVGEGVFTLQDRMWRREVYLFVTLGLAIMLRRRGLLAMHAAAAAHPERGGYMFVGKSGSGKSTLVFSLATMGWQYLTDDSLLLSVEESDVCARPFRRDFCLSRMAVDMFPQLLTSNVQQATFDEAKIRVDAGRLFTDQRTELSYPGTLIFPSISDVSTTTLTPIDRKEALMRLLSQSGLIFDPDPRAADQYLDMLGMLAKQASAYVMTSGRDILEHPDLIPQILP